MTVKQILTYRLFDAKIEATEPLAQQSKAQLVETGSFDLYCVHSGVFLRESESNFVNQTNVVNRLISIFLTIYHSC